MPFTGIANPEQLAILTRTLQEYCRFADIEPGTAGYDDAGWFIMTLFQSGISDPDELGRVLRASHRRTP